MMMNITPTSENKGRQRTRHADDAQASVRDEAVNDTENKRLAQLAIAGDRDARNRLLLLNMRLVASVAKRYTCPGLTREDLEGEGVIGLIRGIEKFDAKKGYQFNTYVTWWIRQAISRAVLENLHQLHIPVYLLEQHLRVKRTASAFLLEHGREPTHEEITAATYLSEEEVREVLALPTGEISFDAEMSTHSGEDDLSPLSDLIADSTSEDEMELILTRTLVEQGMRQLPERDRRVLALRYGLDGEQAHKVRETVTLLGVEHTRVFQLEQRAKGLLRAIVEDGEPLKKQKQPTRRKSSKAQTDTTQRQEEGEQG